MKTPTIRPLPQIESVRIAAIIETKAYFSTTGQGRYPKCVVPTSDQRLIFWLQRRVGGTIGARAPRTVASKPYFTLTWQGPSLRALIAVIEPYATTKLEHLAIIKTFGRTLASTGRHGTPIGIKKERARLRARLAALTHRGVRPT
jgi:hypothetical protein